MSETKRVRVTIPDDVLAKLPPITGHLGTDCHAIAMVLPEPPLAPKGFELAQWEIFPPNEVYAVFEPLARE